MFTALKKKQHSETGQTSQFNSFRLFGDMKVEVMGYTLVVFQYSTTTSKIPKVLIVRTRFGSRPLTSPWRSRDQTPDK